MMSKKNGKAFYHRILFFINIERNKNRLYGEIHSISSQLHSCSYPTGTQRPEDVPLCSCFGRDVPNHNRTKIGRIRFLTSFASAMSGMYLASGNIEKFP